MTTPEPAGRRNKRSRRIARGSKAYRRITGTMALLFGLMTLGFAYSALAPTAQTAAAAPTDAASIAAGAALYNNSCITCHGANLQGIEDRGPSLIGVGE